MSFDICFSQKKKTLYYLYLKNNFAKKKGTENRARLPRPPRGHAREASGLPGGLPRGQCDDGSGRLLEPADFSGIRVRK
mgnify:CR=1 FL=1